MFTNEINIAACVFHFTFFLTTVYLFRKKPKLNTSQVEETAISTTNTLSNEELITPEGQVTTSSFLNPEATVINATESPAYKGVSASNYTIEQLSPTIPSIEPAENIFKIQLELSQLETFLFCKTYLSDRAFINLNLVNEKIIPIFESITNASPQEICTALCNLLPVLATGDIMYNYIAEVVQFSVVQMNQINDLIEATDEIRSNHIRLIRLFGLFGVDSNKLIWDMTNIDQKDSFEIIRQEQLWNVKDLLTATTRERGNPHIITNLMQ
uniref:hypothetical protein n=1 Tax=Batrachospermum sp. TaxID=31373 RepID=UPI001FA7280C|nr:hypothetical protein MRV80_mgp27 [Batrachospermum sp.]UNB13404.1 hypothetical protein [Batrachospermum sp.]